jgi:hypothetical protein
MNPQIIAIITTIGALAVPPVVSLLKRTRWSTSVKQLVAGVLSIAIAAVAIWIVAPKDFGLPLVTLAGLVYAGSQIIYGVYFRGSTVATLLTKIGNQPKALRATGAPDAGISSAPVPLT